MKNDNYIQSANKILPGGDTKQRVLQQILNQKSEMREVKTMNKTLRFFVPIAVSLVIAVTAVLVSPNAKLPGANPDVIAPPATSGLTQNGETQKPLNPYPASDVINFNENAQGGLEKQNDIALFTEDFVEMSKAELIDYYGVNFFLSDLPYDLEEIDEVKYGIKYGVYRRNGGTGEIYYSANGSSYWNENADNSVYPNKIRREINVEVEKGKLPFTCVAEMIDLQKSVISGTEMVLRHTDTSVGSENWEYFYAEFMYKNVGFRITAINFTEEEFVAAVSSLLK